MSPSNALRLHTFTRLIAAVMAASAGWAEADSRVDHYIQVDLGTKWYDLTFHHDDDRSQITGQFDTSVVVTPTVCCRVGNKESNFGLILTGGLAYGSFVAPDLKVDTFEFHLGIGAEMKITSWAHFDVMASVGRGFTWADLPADHLSWDHRQSTWGYSSHAEAIATFAVDCWGARLSANAGYRATGMTLADPDSANRYDDYLIHGFVVGGALGFTF